jgi:hypothetical protein
MRLEVDYPIRVLRSAGVAANGVQRSTWSSIQISLRDSLIGSSRSVPVMSLAAGRRAAVPETKRDVTPQVIDLKSPK